MPSITGNGLEIGYDAAGTGPPLVMLHGATSLARIDFAPQRALFTGAFRMYAPDARGHGRTRWDAAGGFRADWLVDDALAFVDALHLETFHLFGFSMGAMTALRLACRAPRRIRTLVVAGITTQREPRATVARRMMDPSRIDERDPGWAADLDELHGPGQGAGAWRRLLPAIAADVAEQSLLTPRDLRRIEAPSMVIAGDRDPFVPVDHAWGLQRQLPAGRLLIVPDCGHEVAIRRPGLVNEALAAFYRSTEAIAKARADADPAPSSEPRSIIQPPSSTLEAPP